MAAPAPIAHPEVIVALQNAARLHWTAWAFYHAASRHLKRWGYRKLGHHLAGERDDEQKHQKWIIDQLELYDVAVDFDHEQPTFPRNDPIGILGAALELETEARRIEDAGAVLCRNETVQDEDSARVFGHLVTATTETVEWLTGLLRTAEQLGPQNFLQEMR